MSLTASRLVYASAPDDEIVAALVFARAAAEPFGARVGVAYSRRERVLGYEIEVDLELPGEVGPAASVAAASGRLEAAAVAVSALAV